MYRILIALMIGLGLLGMVSCQREYTFSDTPLSPVIDDSTLLLKYIELDSLPGALADTGFVMSLTYDNVGRITNIYTDYSSDSSTNNPFYESLTLLYNGTDTIPYKSINISREDTSLSATNFTDTTFYFYNSTGKLSSDSTTYLSSLTPTNTYARHYNYFPGFIIVTNYSNAQIQEDTVYQSVVNGKIINQHSNPFNGATGIIGDFNYSYDFNPNPFYYATRLSITKPLRDYEDDLYAVFEKNNCTSINQTQGSNTRSLQGTYVYKTNGYPSVVYKVYNSNGVGSTTQYSKGIFIYGRR